MPLVDVPLPVTPRVLSPEVTRLLNAADDRIEQFFNTFSETPVPAFVPSDFVQVYWALDEIANRDLAPTRSFCEWGSGFGVVTCLAAILEWDAVGIEIEPDLIREACALAEEFELPAEFSTGSFIPHRCQDLESELGESSWLRFDGQDAYEELGLDPDDFALISCYPWPGEQQVIFRMFDRIAADGTLLLSYHGLDGVRLQRRVAKRRR